MIDFIKDNSLNPEVGLLEEDEYLELYNKIIDKLTDLEECVFNLKLKILNIKNSIYFR